MEVKREGYKKGLTFRNKPEQFLVENKDEWNGDVWLRNAQHEKVESILKTFDWFSKSENLG